VIRRIAIFGGAGLLGQSLIRRLLDLKNIEIFIFDLTKPELEIAQDPRIKYVHCDVLCIDENQISYLLDGVEEVYFKVGMLGNPIISSRISSAWEFLDINAFSLKRLIPVLTRAKVKRLIVDSSITAVSDISRSGPLQENTMPSIPTNYYGLSKAVLEDICNSSRDIGELDTVIIRYPRVYSSQQDNFINIFARKIIKNEPIDLYGDVDKLVDLVHIDDATEVAVKCLDYENDVRVFHAAYGNPATLGEILDFLLREIGRESYSVNSTNDMRAPREPNKALLADSHTSSELKIQFVHSLNSIVLEAVNTAELRV
jgi:nucleoside-diphosphate-sugar epimerase